MSEPASPLIRAATPADIPDLLTLEARYYVGNLAPTARENGFLSVQHSVQWFDVAVREAGVHVAEIAGDVVGFIAVTKPPRRAVTSPGSLTRSLVDLAHVTHFQGQLVASQRYAVRGPVLIDEAARGRGIYTAFHAVTREVHRDRFDIGVLFVAADNPRSLHTTTVKLGAEPLAVFDVGGRRYPFLAYAF